MSSTLKAIGRTVRELGVDPRGIGRLGMLGRYVADLRKWRRLGGKVDEYHPILRDWQDSAGVASGAYFHQDLLVARKIFEARPTRHVDVGSRIDGFVAHVSVFREIELLDIRPVEAAVRNIRFFQADMMRDEPQLVAITDSLSCLHALEHFGLGRYGDPIDPDGHLRGFRTLVRMLKQGGTLYLSFPVGAKVVEFNAHRVFDAAEVLSWPGSEQLELLEFSLVDDEGALREVAVTSPFSAHTLSGACAGIVHGCGIYTFRRR